MEAKNVKGQTVTLLILQSNVGKQFWNLGICPTYVQLYQS